LIYGSAVDVVGQQVNSFGLFNYQIFAFGLMTARLTFLLISLLL